ncbi:phasin family protein [Methyloligella sp. 2.7D]|uniref:phasin family protein n=1 Tax=unclassified Methyloligella TaxID=2625955 RepID=UPI00157E261A|nr:phasin family protein [Methyloligella sp. GL2]QKP78389.1 phasin family protein [Methyloligella sp. GL2]
MPNEAFSKMEVPESLRALMKMGIEQARYSFETFAANSEKALRAFETNSVTARESVRDLNHRIAEIGRANAEANFAFAMKLAEAKDFNEALAMQSQHAKTQMETFSKQLEEVRDMAAKAIQESNPGAGNPFSPSGSASSPGFGSKPGESGSSY